ncbi:hypothetical protein BS333_07860 [Vibrio azureus]|uniref:Uncharacterized protein n=1 Tax=Vibrio azureus NBRC 104587 TaxID=1219077 RepID=U3AR57_9VIBR|nr:hypothetical protein [Vibrio azureus]AUI86311.1 hypothetical protein BS333_07860 [Vibrio azureus]GAD75752.1 hypothetical protein VAZ01S_029_00220 [Vibrio azureus NBRC 104587]
MGNFKITILSALSISMISYPALSAINESYDVLSLELSADHNEGNGVPMPFFANGRMQSKLNISASFGDQYGSPVNVSTDELKASISFYLKGDGRLLTQDRDCTFGINCWGFTYTPNEYAHQMGASSGYGRTLPHSRIGSPNTTKLTAWVYTNEIAQFRQVCAQIKFDGGKVYDSCQHPQNESAIYQSVEPKVYNITEFADIGMGEEVWKETNYDDFYFYPAVIRNFYITPMDTSVKLVNVSVDNDDEAQRDQLFLNDTWLGCLPPCDDAFRSVKGYIFKPGSERTVSDQYVFNSAAGEGRTATWRVNQKLRSLTISQLLYSNISSNTEEKQQEYRFTAFDQYGNKAPLKIVYPLSSHNGGGQKWDYTKWFLAAQ